MNWLFRFCMVQLMDSVHCRTLDGFLSILILGIQTMMYLELPCISILSKVDTMRANGSFIDGDPQNDCMLSACCKEMYRTNWN